ncbi:heat repeat-containing protein [Anaeramoeba flamelloides]|uniref:HEAT repeat-containing protein 1 n=1 Tax=Anaeramoeba flamelloides TaxID=1746091 RepID=A0ABQ8XTK6_9EUKA|nr:heat repeat-containing protein [Anaeramoeba flamelloides]
MTDLSRQLSEIRKKRRHIPSMVGHSYQTSLIFKPKEALEITNETLQRMALKGLNSLIQQDVRLSRRQGSLLDRSRVDFDRLSLTENENEKLNEELKKFVPLLSPYFMDSNAHYIIEYFIRIYKIHLYNPDLMVKMGLPFHSTSLFTRLLQVLNLNGTKWYFLGSVKRSGHNLTRSTIAATSLRNVWLIREICDLMKKRNEKNLLFTTLISFYTALMIDICDRVNQESNKQLQDEVINLILPYLMSFLSNTSQSKQQFQNTQFNNSLFQDEELSLGSLMILTKICSENLISKKLLKTIITLITNRKNEKIELDLKCLIIIYQNQEHLTYFPIAIIEKFTIDQILDLCSKYDSNRFLSAYFKKLIKKAFQSKKKEDEEMKDENEDDSDLVIEIEDDEENEKNSMLLKYISLTDNKLEDIIIFEILDEMISLYLKKRKICDNKHYQQIIKQLDQRYPIQVDKIINKYLKTVAVEEFWDFIKLIQHHHIIANTNTTVYLALQHSEASIRYIAFEKLKTIITDVLTNKDEQNIERTSILFSDSILLQLNDSDLHNKTTTKIIHLILELDDLLFRIINDKKELINALYVLIKSCDKYSKNKLKLKTFKLIAKYFLKNNKQANKKRGKGKGKEKGKGEGKEKEIEKELKKFNSILFSNLFIQKNTIELNQWVCTNIYNITKNPIFKNINNKNIVKKHKSIIEQNKSLITTLSMELNDKNKIFVLMGYLKENFNYNCSIIFLYSLIELYKNKTLKLIKSELLIIFIQVYELIINCLKMNNEINTNNNIDDINNEKKMYVKTILIKLTNETIHSTLKIKILKTIMNLIIHLIRVKEKESLRYFYKFLLNHKDLFQNELYIFFSIFLNFKSFTIIQFLSSFWFNEKENLNIETNNNNNNDDDDDDNNNNKLQLSSLYYASGIIISTKNEKLQTQMYQLIPSLLTLLASEKKIIRHAVITCYISLLQCYPQDEILLKLISQQNHFLNTKNHLTNFFKSKLNEEIIEQFLIKFLKIKSIKYKYLIFKSLIFFHSKFKLRKTFPLLNELLNNCFDQNNNQKIENNYKEKLFSILMTQFNICFHKEISEKKYYEFLQSSLLCQNDRYQKSAIKTMNPELFKNFSNNLQIKFIKTLIKSLTLMNQKNKILIIQLLKKIQISGKQLINLFNILDDNKENNNQMKIENEHKKNKEKENDNDKQYLKNFPMLLKSLEIFKIKENLTEKYYLTESLFKLLSKFLDKKNPLHKISSREYCKQLILGFISNISNELEDLVFQNNKKKNDHGLLKKYGKYYQINLLVDCMKIGDNPQTHNQALLTLSSIAKLYPHKVVKQIVNIFSYLGEHTLKRDDNYTFIVIEKTINRIIPPILEEGTLKPMDLLEIFTQNLKYIPSQRKIPFFVCLIKKMGVEQLWSLLLIILKKEKLTRDSINFLHQLCDQFKPTIKIECFVKILKKENKNEIINLNTAFQILNFIIDQLDSENYLEQLIKINDKEETNKLQNSYLKLFSILLLNLQKTNNRKIIDHIHEIFQLLHKLLSLENFLPVINNLLINEDSEIRRKALIMLNNRIEMNSGTFSNHEVQLFVSVLEPISKLLKSETKLPLNYQTTLLSVDVLTNNFAKFKPQLFLQFLPLIIDSLTVKQKNFHLLSSIIMCIATLTRNLETLILPYLPKFFPLVVKTLKLVIMKQQKKSEKIQKMKKKQKSNTNNTNNNNNTEIQDNEENEIDYLLVISCLSCIESVILKIPQFMSAYLENLFSLLLCQNLTSDSNKIEIQDMIENIFDIIAEKISARVLLNPIFNIFKFATVSGTNSLCFLFNFLNKVCLKMDSEAASIYYKSLLKFFLVSFDLRNNQSVIGMKQIQTQNISFTLQEKQDQIDLIESTIMTAFISLIMKLNENMFKQIFLKILHWATANTFENENKNEKNEDDDDDDDDEEDDEEDSIKVGMSKMIVLFRLCDYLISRLKTVFVPYFEYLSEYFLEIITNAKTVDKKYLYEYNLVLNYCFDYLRKSFLYDTSGYFDQEKFQLISQPLTNCLSDQIEGETTEMFTERMEGHLIPCLAQFAVTLSDDLLWKPLNYQIWLQSRSENALVRITVLKTIRELYNRLGEEFVIVTPDSIQFISELMEDSDIHVESLCQQVIKTIEQYLGGKSIRDYLI